ncbi:MAG: polyribonucleotide nucleotidyltransferase [candidate division NC10 bacterium]|nr:polyribonucleotide nucleotidyltransferase [candidate division NC10 bacterium]
MSYRVERTISGRVFSIEAGRVARQADGAVWLRYGETIVLVTVVAAKQPPKEGVDFFPLTVDYQERMYAAGRIPGSFFRREGRPHERETVTARLIDRSIRPLFPKGYKQEVQIIGTVLSFDGENDPDVLALVGASAALTASPIPFQGPVGALRVGRIQGGFVLNPTYPQLEESDLDLVVAGTEDAVVMVEAGAKEVPEEVVLQAIDYGHHSLKILIDMQRELAQAMGVQKPPFVSPEPDDDLRRRVDDLYRGPIRELVLILDKEQQKARRQEILNELMVALAEEPAERRVQGKGVLEEIERDELRRLILEEGQRPDGRKLDEVRPITCEVGVLPRTHGSALFSRGQTQALVTTTLGTSEDEQKLDDIEGEGTKRFMLHYNFPPSSVGEVRFLRGPGRREIGHGLLAERALSQILPSKETSPYIVRLVSDILESNGSSSMATVCGGSLALMDAGVPVKGAVGGVAIGLIMGDGRYAILTDIMGLEDHLGDMDFKVAGTRTGITALQMDIKVPGITIEIMAKALNQAKTARYHVLDIMDRTLPKPRAEISKYAPRIIAIQIPLDKIREVIGPGGKMIRSIIEQTGVKIDVDDSGRVEIASVDEAAAQRALNIISKIIEVPEVGKVYLGKVVRIMDFGAFVEILPGTDGLLHISQISDQRVQRVEDVLSEGDEVLVKVIEIDKSGKIRLSRKELLKSPTTSGGRKERGETHR